MRIKRAAAADEGEAAVDNDRELEETTASMGDAVKGLEISPVVVEPTVGVEEEVLARTIGGVRDPHTAKGGVQTDVQHILISESGVQTDRQERGAPFSDIATEENPAPNRDWQVQEVFCWR